MFPTYQLKTQIDFFTDLKYQLTQILKKYKTYKEQFLYF